MNVRIHLLPAAHPLQLPPSAVLEQLPLSLHRAFTLIQELDQQAQGPSSSTFLPSSSDALQSTSPT